MKRHHPRAKRLQVVLELAERDEQQALQNWGEIQQKLQQEEQQRQQLSAYRGEYQSKISAPGNEQISAGHIHNTLGFMAQIESAMKSQAEQISVLTQQAESARELYLKLHGKTKALTELIERLEQEAASAEDKQAQKLADEWANRAAFHQSRR